MWIDPLSRRFLNGAGLIPARQGRGPVVLMYHSISNGRMSPANQWSVSARNFKNQLSLLQSEGWTSVCVSDLLHADSLPPRTVVITFDDGYADNFEHVFRILSDCGMRSTWFIVSRDVGKLSSWKDANNQVRPMLAAQQLREMAASGIEIGAHTRTHARLPEMDMMRIEEEVTGSKKDLEDMLGLPITSFAYPYGLFNEKCVETVKKAGFTVACTSRTGWFGSDPDLLRVRRVAIFSHDRLSTFARKLAFADTNVAWDRMVNYLFTRIRSKVSGCETG